MVSLELRRRFPAHGVSDDWLGPWAGGAGRRARGLDGFGPAVVGGSRGPPLARPYRALSRTRLGRVARRPLASRVPRRPLGLVVGHRPDLVFLPGTRLSISEPV